MKKTLITTVALITISAASFGQQLSSIKWAVRSHGTFEITPILNPATSQTWVGDGASREQHLYFDIGNEFSKYEAKRGDTIKIDHIYLELNNFRLRFLSSTGTHGQTLKFNSIYIKQGSGIYDEIYSNPVDVSSGSVPISDLPDDFQSLGTDTVELIFFSETEGLVKKIHFTYSIIPKSDDHYQDAAGNTMTVWRSQQTNAVPIVAAEGVDFTDTRPAQYYWRLDGARMFNCMLDAGFDVYMVDFKRGQEDIAYNARHFQYAIKKVAADVNRDVVAVGFSMGGVINRYACSHAEQYGNALPISHMVCIDAPQKGAIVNKDMQLIIREAENFLWTEIDGSPNGFGGPTDKELDGLEALEFQLNPLKTPTAKQLLSNNIFDLQQPYTMHEYLYGDLNSFANNGYPNYAKTIGVSFGTIDIDPANNKIAEIYWDSGATGVNDDNMKDNLESLNFNVTSGHNVYDFNNAFKAEVMNDDESSKPGSFFPSIDFPIIAIKSFWNNFLFAVETEGMDKMTFMPISSTLHLDVALDTSTSRFDEIIMADAMYDHDNIPAIIRTPLLLNVIKEDVRIQNRTFIGQHKIYSLKTIRVGSNVDNSQPFGPVNGTSTAYVEFLAGESVSFEAGFDMPLGTYLFANGGIDEPDCGDEFEQGRTADNSTVLQQEESEEIIIGQSSKPFKVGVYPNPIESGELHVDLKVEAEGAASIKLFSMDGKMVLTVNTPTTLTEGEHQFQLNTNELRAGMYFLEIIVDNQRQITKVVKQ